MVNLDVGLLEKPPILYFLQQETKRQNCGFYIQLEDPLSSLLFLLISKVLGAIINKLYDNGHFEGFMVGKDKSHIPILQYADDTILFCKYDEAMLLKLKKAINLFEWCSGQKVNLDKSALSGVNVGEKDLLQKT